MWDLGLRKPARREIFSIVPSHGTLQMFAAVVGHSCDIPVLIFLGVQSPSQKCRWQEP